MRLKSTIALLAAAVLSTSCGGALAGGTINFSKPTVSPDPVYEFGIVACAVPVALTAPCPQPISGAKIEVQHLDGWVYSFANGDGYALMNATIPYSAVRISANGFQTRTASIEPPKIDKTNQTYSLTPAFPAPPTRDQVLKLCMSFQGLNVQTSFGNEPYFEASLAWHDLLSDRQAIYAAKHASKNAFCPNGDTHAMVFVPWGHALYDEGGQFYTADKFPPLDWTNGNTAMDPKFVALVSEVIQNGFIPLIVGAEDYSWVDDGKWDAQASLIVHALQAAPVADLTKYSSLMPGFDGVFYGAANDQVTIPRWASSIRSYCPLCYVVIEHQTGHIPLGEGPSDWASGARMQVYDALYSEFNDDQFDDTVWQIGARTLGLVSKGGSYVRPPDQPAGDDTNAPWYMADAGPRGRLYACAIEFGTYGWVRRSYDAAHVAQQREYFRKVGYTCGG